MFHFITSKENPEGRFEEFAALAGLIPGRSTGYRTDAAASLERGNVPVVTAGQLSHLAQELAMVFASPGCIPANCVSCEGASLCGLIHYC